jgi:hypothetical protein
VCLCVSVCLGQYNNLTVIEKKTAVFYFSCLLACPFFTSSYLARKSISAVFFSKKRCFWPFFLLLAVFFRLF